MKSKKKKQLIDFVLYLSIGLTSIFLIFKYMPNQFVIQTKDQLHTRLSEEDVFTVLFFHKEGCPHCELARPVLKKLQDKYPRVGWAILSLSSPNERTLESYSSWLRAGKITEAVTPLIVIGPASAKPWLTSGFLNEEEDRPLIENEIRRRLELDPIDFKNTSIHVPFKGYSIMTEMGHSFQVAFLGLFSGFMPMTMLLLAWWSLLKTPTVRTYAALVVGLFGFTLLLRAYWIPIHMPVWIDGTLRILAGIIVLLSAFKGFFRFFKDSEWLFQDTVSWKPMTIIFIGVPCIFLDLSLTQWLNEMRRLFDIPVFSGFGLYFAIPFLSIFLIHFLVVFMKKNGYPRLKLLFFLFLLINLYWGLLLTTGHGFSGYGSWHWFGA